MENVSASISSRPPAFSTPALLIIRSSPPNSLTVVMIRSLTEPASETSVLAKIALFCDFLDDNKEAKDLPFSSFRSAIMIFMFNANNDSAMPAPNPWAPPVTIAILLFSLFPEPVVWATFLL